MIPKIKRFYRRAVPAVVRQSVFAARVKECLYAHFLGHDAIYDYDYYASDVEGPAIQSAGAISESIVRDLKPASVIDVGCGTGALLDALRRRGCRVVGLEYSEAALQCCRARSLEVVRFDLEEESVFRYPRFDVAVSMEVAEHLPERVADSYVDLLTRMADTIVFTAAPPGQGGVDHVNEQPRSYWIGRFEKHGFRCDDETVERWRLEWESRATVADWYYRNLMVVRRAAPAPSDAGSGA